MPQTYLENLHHFLHFLTAYIHSVLALRSLYSRTSFLTTRFHNTPIFQSRHPAVCNWINDAVTAVRNELLNGSVARLAIVIYHIQGERQAKAMERYMLDVSRFPVVSKADREMEIEFFPESEPHPSENGKGKAKVLDADVESDLSEQFRAALVLLTTRCSQLKPLPLNCSFNLAIELKAEVDPPIGHPQPWIPVEPSLQKTGRGTVSSSEDGSDKLAIREGSRKEGQDIGGVHTTPIRAVETGVLQFETWIEESKAKFENLKSS